MFRAEADRDQEAFDPPTHWQVRCRDVTAAVYGWTCSCCSTPAEAGHADDLSRIDHCMLPLPGHGSWLIFGGMARDFSFARPATIQCVPRDCCATHNRSWRIDKPQNASKLQKKEEIE